MGIDTAQSRQVKLKFFEMAVRIDCFLQVYYTLKYTYHINVVSILLVVYIVSVKLYKRLKFLFRV